MDSSGKADLGNIDRLTIPKKTTGDAKQTSLVQLGLNFPADASVITVPFNRSNPASYNKTTALTVYDQGGNSYLATVYYAKTQNASQADPTNKWQTYVYIGDTKVNASLIAAKNDNNESNALTTIKISAVFGTTDEKHPVNGAVPSSIALRHPSENTVWVKFSLVPP